MKKYVILRDLSGASDGFGHHGSTRDFKHGPAKSTDREAPDMLPAPAVETAELNQRQAEDTARDPQVRGIGEIMPTVLLAPIPVVGEEQAATAMSNWGIAAIGADTSPFTGNGVRVAVLDTGIDAGHAAFQGVNLICRDFTGSVMGQPISAFAPGWDVDGHGTHCAGTIFGRDVGPDRIGVARGIKQALICKALDDRGRGTTEILFQALQWAINDGVDVISMSIGFDFPGLVQDRISRHWSAAQAASDALAAYGANLRLFDALMAMVRTRARFNEGTVIVAASGNESDRSRNIRIATSVPAAAEGMVSVGAVAQTQGRLETAFFSNTAPLVCAPGVAIPSAKSGGGLAVKSGTSMACPHVAGVAALWWEALRAASPKGRASADGVMTALKRECRSREALANFDPEDHGCGLVAAPTASDV